MQWLTSNFRKLAKENIADELRMPKTLAFINAIIEPLDSIRKDVLYQNQHNGQKIYLEKVLNDYYSVPGFDPTNHQATKLIYIESIPRPEELYIFQDAEDDVTFLEDDGDDSDLDTFLEDDAAGGSADFIIFIPDTIDYDEVDIATQMERYCYYNGKQYTIQTYTI